MIYGLDIEVCMVCVSYEPKPYRKMMIRPFSGEVCSSPTTRTDVAGR